MAGALKRGFNLAGSEDDSAIVALTGTPFNQLTLQPSRSIGNADLLQYFKGGKRNLLALRFGQGAIGATPKANGRILVDRFQRWSTASIVTLGFQSSAQTASSAMRRILSASSISDFRMISGGIKLIRSGEIDRR